MHSWLLQTFLLLKKSAPKDKTACSNWILRFNCSFIWAIQVSIGKQRVSLLVSPHRILQRRLGNTFPPFHIQKLSCQGEDIIHLMHLAGTVVHSILTVTVLHMYFSVLLQCTNWKVELCVIALEQQKKTVTLS